MTGKKTLYALFGNPVQQSLSPAMHNAAYRAMGIHGQYTACKVQNPLEILKRIKQLNIAGASITIPFKESFMDYLDNMSEDTRKIGAVNTVMNRNDMIEGYNTDWTGLVTSLKEAAITIKGQTFVILGAGGAARAAAYGIMAENGTPCIINRTPEKGMIVAKEFGCDFINLQDIDQVRAHCLINTTPVGMTPQIDQSLLQGTNLKNFKYVLDMIYNPLQTKLLKLAQSAGCITVSGLGMFVHQGAEQIKKWTGKEPPRALMKQVVLEGLQHETY